jgi:hypothetical protein
MAVVPKGCRVRLTREAIQTRNARLPVALRLTYGDTVGTVVGVVRGKRLVKLDMPMAVGRSGKITTIGVAAKCLEIYHEPRTS